MRVRKQLRMGESTVRVVAAVGAVVDPVVKAKVIETRDVVGASVQEVVIAVGPKIISFRTAHSRRQTTRRRADVLANLRLSVASRRRWCHRPPVLV